MHDLKMVPKRKLSEPKPDRRYEKPRKAKKKKKGVFSRVFDEAWDVIEDIFD
ncbi:hypothetical protein [Ruegeria lacuscaerulensis]|uniref:hypothetical protein n=1 Tax=Ruegeria lacuscaerulensis TaxID=55218 RepID=UPI003013A4D1